MSRRRAGRQRRLFLSSGIQVREAKEGGYHNLIGRVPSKAKEPNQRSEHRLPCKFRNLQAKPLPNVEVSLRRARSWSYRWRSTYDHGVTNPF